jgi:hypothetical protein
MEIKCSLCDTTTKKPKKCKSDNHQDNIFFCGDCTISTKCCCGERFCKNCTKVCDECRSRCCKECLTNSNSLYESFSICLDCYLSKKCEFCSGGLTWINGNEGPIIPKCDSCMDTILCDMCIEGCDQCNATGCYGCGTINVCNICANSLCVNCLGTGYCSECGNGMYCENCLDENKKCNHCSI